MNRRPVLQAPGGASWRYLPVALRGAGLAVALAAILASTVLPRLSAQRSSPRIVVETSQGAFAFDTFDRDAPVSVAHIVALARAGFYDGQRVHRAVGGFLVQFGDPQTRDLEKRPLWGKGPDASSGKPIGVAEVTLKRRNVALAVGLAHMGEPAKADSQLYIMLATRPELDGQYAVIGEVVQGEDVPSRLRVGDEIRRVSVQE